MTEKEWKEAKQPLLLVDSIPNEAQSIRRKRLAICGISRVCYWSASIRCSDWIDFVEKYAEGLISDNESIRLQMNDRIGSRAYNSSRLRSLLYIATLRKFQLRNALTILKQESTQSNRASDVLRDIFGNPFRPVAFDPRWRTDTAVGIAQQMYDARDFNAMPILADALQDAGCEHADILNHCRNNQEFGPVGGVSSGPNATHVRGCWVVDLVLGKS